MSKVNHFIAVWLSKIVFRIADRDKKESFRSLEKLLIKLEEIKSHRIFNQCCITNNLLPKYTNIKPHDEAARTDNITYQYRINLIKRQINEQDLKIAELSRKAVELNDDFKNMINSEIRHKAFMMFLDHNVTAKKISLTEKHNKKLTELNGGPIFIKDNTPKFINLSNKQISPELADVFNLGMACHVKKKFDHLTKKIEVEKLYRNIEEQCKKDKVVINNSEVLKCELKRFGLSHTKDFNRDILSKKQIDLVKNFKDNKDIIVRKADKSNTFVIMNMMYYTEKIESMLADEDKFEKVATDPTPQLKKELRTLVTRANKHSKSIKFPLPVGHYEPGYTYGNPKMHKDKLNPPFRLIVSQIGTITYEISKRLNDILTPYLPAKHMISSTNEFISIAKGVERKGLLASLDVESLFTNVPVIETINIILNNTYHNPTVAPPDIPEMLMKSLLEICTTKTPFRHLNGDIYIQRDGVSMGNPLGCLFANMYMCHIENNIIPTLTNKPIVYARYVDDIFLMIHNIKTLEEIQSKFQNSSVLTFTYEIEKKKTLAFLDVNVRRNSQSKLDTSVHTKETSSGECLNYLSIAPEMYKLGVIRTFLHRAYNVCSTWTAFHSEITRIHQLLANNNYPQRIIEREINIFLNRKIAEEQPKTDHNEIIFYFKNQMTSLYKQEERRIKEIITNNLKGKNDEKIKLLVYYKSKKVRDLFIKNNIHNTPHEKKSHVVYSFSCKYEGCRPLTQYIGYTECVLADRMRNHAQNGAIIKHSIDAHQHKLTTAQILEHTKILRHFTTKEELLIAEALLIKDKEPLLNGQKEGEVRVLQIF